MKFPKNLPGGWTFTKHFSPCPLAKGQVWRKCGPSDARGGINLKGSDDSWTAETRSKDYSHDTATPEGKKVLIAGSPPYEVEIRNGKHLAITACSGRVLSKLDNRPEVIGEEFSVKFIHCEVETDLNEMRTYEVSYKPDGNGTLFFAALDGLKPSIDDIESWICENFDRIAEEGYKVLLDRYLLNMDEREEWHDVLSRD